MRTVQTTAAGLPAVGKTSIRWKRVIIAAVLSEVLVIAVIALGIATYSLIIAPGRPSADNSELGQNVGYYVSAPAATVAVFLMAFWAIRRLDSGFVLNGVCVGVIATLLTVGFVFGARPGDRAMYIAGFILRIAAGYAAGVAAQRMKESR
jgi:hypothetical protein